MTTIVQLNPMNSDYAVSFTGDLTEVTNDVNFLNTGEVRLGNATIDAILFDGGLSTFGNSSNPVMTHLFGSVRTSGDDVDLGVTMLDGNSAVDSTNMGGTSGANIVFHEALDGQTGVMNGVVLTAGTGNIDFMANVGAGNEVGAIEIKPSMNVTAHGTINALSLDQKDGAGTTDLRDDVTTHMHVKLDANVIRLVGTAADLLEVKATDTDGKVNLNVPVLEQLEMTNAKLSAGNASISEMVLARNAELRFTALDRSVNVGPPIIGAKGTGQIRVDVVDAQGVNFDILLDWQESNPQSPSPISEFIDGSDPNGTDRSELLTHFYLNTPITVGGFIPVTARVMAFGNDAVEVTVSGTSVLNLTTGGVEGIQALINVPFVAILGTVDALPTPEPLPEAPTIPVVPVRVVDVVTPLAETVTAVPDVSSAGVTAEREDRYYELRIVSIDINGNATETKVQRDGVSALELKAIQPFDLSKLPELFGRLPADRYRIYLIEDGAERLVLDFIIRQGQPIEIPEEDSENAGGDSEVTDPFEEDAVQPQDLDNGPLPPQDGVAPSTTPVTFSGTDEHLMQNAAVSAPRVLAHPTLGSGSFAERFGQARFYSHGGVVVGVAALATAANRRRERSMDRLMERFGDRRRFAQRRRPVSTESDSTRPLPILLTRSPK
jgi:hypothetical protein